MCTRTPTNTHSHWACVHVPPSPRHLPWSSLGTAGVRDAMETVDKVLRHSLPAAPSVGASSRFLLIRRVRGPVPPRACPTDLQARALPASIQDGPRGGHGAELPPGGTRGPCLQADLSGKFPRGYAHQNLPGGPTIVTQASAPAGRLTRIGWILRVQMVPPPAGSAPHQHGVHRDTKHFPAFLRETRGWGEPVWNPGLPRSS